MYSNSRKATQLSKKYKNMFILYRKGIVLPAKLWKISPKVYCLSSIAFSACTDHCHAKLLSEINLHVDFIAFPSSD